MENACPNIRRTSDEKKFMNPDDSLTDTDISSRDEPVQKKLKVHHTSAREEEKLIWNDVVTDHPARLAGRIMRVELENFLCFSKEELKLHPFINFITGKNGAGKSTYATAIAVALGSKMVYKKQHRRLEDYIKADSSSTTIRLYMNNQGEHAYRRDEFGPCVLLTRKINKRCVGSYSLSCPDGTKRISGRARFMDAVEGWGIQIDNPVFFMDQEESKTFLIKNKPDEFYRFFHGASGLAFAEQLTQKSEDVVDGAADKLLRKEEELKEAEKELTEWRKRRDAAESRFGAAEDYRTTEAQMEWWKALDAADAIRKYEIELREIDEKIHETDRKLADEQRVSMPTSSRKSSSRNVHFNHRMAVQQQEMEDVDMHWKTHIEVKEAEIKVLRKLIEDKEKRLRRQSHSLRSSSRRRTANNSFSDTDQINALQHSLNDAEQKRDKLAGDIAERRQLELKADKLKRQRDSLRQEMEAVTNTGKGDVAELDDYYGLHERITTEIGKRKLKVAEVTGPVGKFVDLRDQQYRSAVDQTIGNVLHSYIFDLDLEQDMEPVIMEVRKSCKLSNIPIAPVALSSKSRSGSSSTNLHVRTTENGVYIKDALNFESTRVDRFLAEVTKLDCVVTVDSSSDAEKLLSDLNINDHVERIIDNKGNTYEYCDEYAIISTPATSFFHTPGFQEQLSKRDLEQKLQEATTSLSEIEESLSHARNTSEALEQKRDENDQSILDISSKLAALRSSDSFAAHSSIVSEDEDDPQSSIAGHKQKLEELKYQKKELEKKRIEERALRKQQIASEETQQNVLTQDENFAADETPVKSGRKGGRKRNVVVQLEQDRYVLLKRRQELLSKKDTKDLEFKEHEQICDKQGINVQSGVPKENRKKLEARLEKLRQKDIALSVDGGYSLKVCQEHVDRFARSCNESRKQLGIFRATVTEAKNKREVQKSIEAVLRKRFEDRTSDTCKGILVERGLIGRLKFEGKELRYFVGPANDSSKLGPLETLSGGEKAFAMVALLVSFWESNHPFRILDEFDCFMDAQNRQAAMSRLIKKALEDRVQCIFLSPLEFDFEKIRQMAGPEERGYIMKIIKLPSV